LEKAIHDINPDVILTQQSFAVPTIEVSKKNNKPTVLFLRNYDHFPFIQVMDGEGTIRKDILYRLLKHLHF